MSVFGGRGRVGNKLPWRCDQAVEAQGFKCDLMFSIRPISYPTRRLGIDLVDLMDEMDGTA
jgi:hypothetical protein